ncbi:MAG TPA: bifunctional (p)ppGpp synthetase/guanosine-3',5'-bis(diphosphate) 3'-pyrophosphohydrolase [Armatimonadota bacterium]|jgi:GTP pyrophosphokinase
MAATASQLAPIASAPIDQGMDVYPEEIRISLEEGYTRLVNAILSYSPMEDVETLRAAFEFASVAHSKQIRETGDPYIVHPLEVAEILASLELDMATIIAGLLHDTVEDTGVTLEDVRKRFGDEIAQLVDGVTKLKRADFEHLQRDSGAAPQPDEPKAEGEDGKAEGKRRGLTDAQRQAENLRKILLAVARDFRVMIIKLADRLHNMKTLSVKSPEKQRRIATETLQIYAPLAHRLGVGRIKWQLEDLAFKYLYPEEFAQVADMVARTRKEREGELADVMDQLKGRLAEEGIHAQIQGRPKHLFSIWNKMRKQELSFEQLYDLVAIRVIVETVAECYQALGIVHELWIPLPGLFSDYIARPKSNMYQSLHTKVLGPIGAPLEVQIRTFEMHRTADYGVAAHWQYKEGGGKARDDFERKMAFMSRQLFEWDKDNQSEFEFLRSVVDDLFFDQVFVFTPKGDVIDLPAGATIVDFAFRVHTRLGEHCAGGRINGKIAPLSTQLKNGDIVDVTQRASVQPSLDWLSFVKTSHAKAKIRSFFRKAHYTENAQKGRESLEREVQRLGLEPHTVLKPEMLEKVAKAMNYVSVEDLYAAIGGGQAAAQTVVNRLRDQIPVNEDKIFIGKASEARLDITAGGVDEVLISRARCCSPLPGEDVVGYVTQGRGVMLHIRTCKNLISLTEKSPERVTEISWRGSAGERYPVPVRIDAFDRVGLLQDISSIFSANNTNIREASIKSRANHRAVLELQPDVESAQQLESLLANVRKLGDVLDVYRITSAADAPPDTAQLPLSSQRPA